MSQSVSIIVLVLVAMATRIKIDDRFEDLRIEDFDSKLKYHW